MGVRRRTDPAMSFTERARLGGLAGLVAAAATGGALAGFGMRDGGALRAFGAVGRAALLDAPLESGGARMLAAVVGLFVHVGVLGLWGVLLGVVAAPWRGIRLLAAASVLSAMAFLVHRAVLPALLRPGNAVTALTPQIPRLVALHALLAISLAIGMRVAKLGSRLDERTR